MISRFRRKKQADFVLQCQENNHREAWFVSFQLCRGNIIVPVPEWLTSNHPGAAWLIEFIKMNDIECDFNDTVELPFIALMAEFEGQESYLRGLLELPELFDGGLHLESQGLLSSEDYKLSYGWLNGNGRPIIQSERHGIFIIVGSKKYLLPWHAWKMAENLEIIQA